jgi:L-cysteine S-thiosulfotransferase
MEDYLPHVKGDMSLSGSYKHWKDPEESGLADGRQSGGKLEAELEIHGSAVQCFGAWRPFCRRSGRGTIFNELNGKSAGRLRLSGRQERQLKGLRTQFPMYRKDLKHVAGLEEVIEHCAAKEGRELQNGSYDNSAVSLYIASQSAGMPIKINVTSAGPLKSAYERGRKVFHARAGTFQSGCSSCHTYQIGLHLRGTVVTSPYGDVAHYPVYRTRYQLQSLHLRFVECNLDTRTQPLCRAARLIPISRCS